jgi:hypothetical protein
MNSIFNSFKNFISTNQPPNQDKILTSLLVVLCFSLIIFLLSALLFNLRTIDILKVKNYTVRKCLIWISGAVLLDFILMATKIINYNIISFLVVAMVWDNIYKKIFSQAKEREIASLDTIEE